MILDPTAGVGLGGFSLRSGAGRRLAIWAVLYIRVPLRGSFFIRVPYYIGDLKRDPNIESYPFGA